MESLTSPTRKTILIDASALRESSCILRTYRKIIQGYKLATPSSDIVFGSAFHTFRSTYEETGDEIQSTIEAVKYFTTSPKWVKSTKGHLNLQYLNSVCTGWNNHYTLMGDEYDIVKTKDGKPLVELRIAYPYFVTPEGDIEVLLCGTIDRIVRSRTMGYYAISDYKTTSIWDVQKYFSTYELSTQLMFYKLLLSLYAKLFPTSIIAEVCSGHNVGAFIDGVFLGAGKSTKYERSKVFWYSKERMEEFQRGVDVAIWKIIDYARAPEKLFREGMINGSCEKVYGMCDFYESCICDNVQDRDLILNEQFIRDPYNPMTFGTL